MKPPRTRKRKNQSFFKFVVFLCYNNFSNLPKLDLIAIPDFVTGAMEQWGLITYRETSLLWDPIEGSTSSKETVVS